jgi:hypothetical protein
MKTTPLLATLLLVFAVTPLALAQAEGHKSAASPGQGIGGDEKAKKPKKGTAAPSASADSDSAAAPAASSAPAASAAAETAPSAAPSAAESAGPKIPEAPPEPLWDSQNTYEDPKDTYYYLGLQYRGTVIPQFLENLFVNDGATVYSNTVGLALDMRKEGHSTIPWITYTDYGLGNTIYFEKNKPDAPENYSMVSSSLKAIYLGLDELWSIPLEPTHKVDFEFGFGIGLGFVFGSLVNDWVYIGAANSPNAVKGANGNYYVPCVTMGDAASCSAGAHSNPPPGGKVNNYQEKDWFSGGGVPDIFPRISLQLLGVRYKPIKQMELRLGAGFALTEGFWFQLSGFYGLEHPKETGPKAQTSGPQFGSF